LEQKPVAAEKLAFISCSSPDRKKQKKNDWMPPIMSTTRKTNAESLWGLNYKSPNDVFRQDSMIPLANFYDRILYLTMY